MMTPDHDAPWRRLLAALRAHPPGTWPAPLASAVAALVADTYADDEETPTAPLLTLVPR